MVTAIDLGRRAFIGGAAALAGMAMSTGARRKRRRPRVAVQTNQSKLIS
jgi:hypothetical protein